MKLIVVGAGLVGLSIAWRAAARGIEVTVVDDAWDRAASRVGAGLLIPAGGRVSHRHLQLRAASAERYPGFVEELLAETGLCSGYNPCGTLTLAYQSGAEAALDGLGGCLKGLGVDCQRLTADQCLELEPALSPEIGGGLLTPDHQVDPERMLLALKEACLGRIVSFIQERAARVESKLVCLAGGRRLSGDRVVVAAGAWARELVELDIFPVKGEVLHLQGPELVGRNLRVQREDLYVANRGDGRLVIGATEQEQGFDESRTGRELLLQRALRLLPDLKGHEVTDHRVGFRPKVADGLPLIGEFRGVVVAGAHYRNGILLAPVTADLVTEYLVEERVPELMEPFSPEREIKDRRSQ